MHVQNALVLSNTSLNESLEFGMRQVSRANHGLVAFWSLAQSLLAKGAIVFLRQAWLQAGEWEQHKSGLGRLFYASPEKWHACVNSQGTLKSELQLIFLGYHKETI